MTKPSGRGRHSFIQFYMNDWLAGTARMPRLVRSVYFDVCCYNWDKVQAVPTAEQFLMLSDLMDGQGSQIIDALIASGQIVRDDQGGIYSPRAMAEAQRALEAWQGKSRGGKGGKTVASELEDTSNSVPLEPEPEPEPEEKERSNDLSKNEGGEEKPIPVAGSLEVAEAWNAMAVTCGLKQMVKLTEERRKRLKARIEEHGAQTIIEAIATVPDFPFLLGKGPQGWKANFDWLLTPRGCVKLIEGSFEKGRSGSSWLN